MNQDDAYKNHPAWQKVATIQNALSDGPDTTTSEAARAQQRLVAVMAHLRAMSDDPHVLSSLNTLNQLESNLNGVAQHVTNWQNGSGEQSLAAAEAALESVIDVAVRLPFTKDRLSRGSTQEAAAAAELAQRTVEQAAARLEEADAGFSADLASLNEEVTALRNTLAELDTQATTTGQLVDAQVVRLQSAIDEAQEQVEAATAARTAATQKAVDELRVALQGELKEYSDKLEDRRGEFEKELQAQRDADATKAQGTLDLLADIEIKAKRAAERLGGITTSSGYAKRAEDEQETADKLRWAAVGVFAGSFALFLVLLLTHKYDNASSLTALSFRLSGSITLLVAGGYLAKESAQHRREERRARAMQLDLNAMPAFIANLSDEAQRELQQLAAKRLFTTDAQPAGENDDGAVKAKDLLVLIREIAGKGK